MRSLAVAALIAAAGCHNGPSQLLPPDDMDGSTRSFRQGLTLGSSQEVLRRGLAASRFNFAHLRDLWVRVSIADTMPHATVVYLVFINPAGERFYEDRHAYSPDPAMDSQMMDVPGMISPMQVYMAEQVTGGYVLDRAIPVGGTVFQRFPPEGQWKVEATVDGVPGAFTAPLFVTMQR